ncbi:MAG: glycosyltransferase N-terminal domain-containing protein [Phycisphaerales bacterium]|nr:glycosyltransferase N-terminal domain-containing protein [Phycisphaerales bacterium]
MFLLLDLLYLALLPLIAFTMLLGRLRGHPPRSGLAARFGVGETLPPSNNRILIHAVSVGEVNAIRNFVTQLASRGYDLTISVTTDTGMNRAEELYGATHTVVRYPVDLSWSVKKFLTRINPKLVVLVELEVWPNMLKVIEQRHIRVVVVNGRLSDRSFTRYSRVSWLLRKTFGRLTWVGMQNEAYATKVQSLGAKHVEVLGTMKWDNAIIQDSVEGAEELSKNLKIDSSKPLIVAGSTTPEEHELLRKIMSDDLQLLVAPRRPEWFDEAAQTLAPCNRRTESQRTDTNFFVLDTIGELTAAYSLATIVVIGRSFAPMHGSDPTEPIGLGKPTIIGPNVSDFTDIIHAFTSGEGIVQCSQDELKDVIYELLSNNDRCRTLVENGRKIIQSNQGATTQYVQLVEKTLLQ